MQERQLGGISPIESVINSVKLAPRQAWTSLLQRFDAWLAMQPLEPKHQPIHTTSLTLSRRKLLGLGVGTVAAITYACSQIGRSPKQIISNMVSGGEKTDVPLLKPTPIPMDTEVGLGSELQLLNPDSSTCQEALCIINASKLFTLSFLTSALNGLRFNPQYEIMQPKKAGVLVVFTDGQDLTSGETENPKNRLPANRSTPIVVTHNSQYPDNAINEDDWYVVYIDLNQIYVETSSLYPGKDKSTLVAHNMGMSIEIGKKVAMGFIKASLAHYRAENPNPTLNPKVLQMLNTMPPINVVKYQIKG